MGREMAPSVWRMLLLLGMMAGMVPRHSNGHICIISPQQRGPFDVSKSGSPTCTRHGAPCGGQPPQEPQVTYIGGSSIFVTFQQNYNHYEVGHPGYMDVALATSSNPSARFNIMGVFGDVNEYAQDNQQNYSLPLVLPDIDCSHCVLRARYVAHKEGEMIFYQCSDIMIKSSVAVGPIEREQRHRAQAQPPPGNRAVVRPVASDAHAVRLNGDAATLYGFAWNEEKAGSSLVSVDTVSGAKRQLSPMHFSLGSGIQYGTPSPMAQSNKYVMEQIACYDREVPYLNLLEHGSGSLDAAPNKLLGVDMATKEIVGEYELVTPNQLPVVSLVPYRKQVYLAVQIEETLPQSGAFFFIYGTLGYMGHFEPIANTSSRPDHDYVNYQWATLNYQTKTHYMLIGNENSPDKLAARVFTLQVPSKQVSVTELDVSRYTITAIHVYEKTGEVLAMSPGLFGNAFPAWTLVTVDPKSGAIKQKYPVAPAGIFGQYYGGNVINIDQEAGILYYVLRVANSQNDVIATISLETGKVTFSRLTDLRNIYNLAFYN